MSNQIADMVVEICRQNPQINPLIAVMMAMQALDPHPGQPFTFVCVSDAAFAARGKDDQA